MSFEDLLNMTCTIVKKSFGPLRNTHGQPQEIDVLVPGVRCGLQEQSVVEGRRGDQSSVSKCKLYLNYGEDITERDQVVIGTRRFDVREVRDPGGRQHHLRVTLEAIK